jgi:hypothetical protein
MTDPQAALGGILPGWFRPAFLLAAEITAGMIAVKATMMPLADVEQS